MSLEQTIRDTLVSESMDLDARLQQLVRAGLMPQNTLPILRKSIAKVQMGLSLQGPERDVMATFINSMMYIVLGDDTIFNKARAGAKSYAAEETEIEEASTYDKNKQYIEITHQLGHKKRVPVHPLNAYKALNRYRNDPSTKSARIVSEAKEKQEYDYEGDMAMSQLKSIIANSQKMHAMLRADTNLPEWVQSKITLAEDYITTAANYMQGEMSEAVGDFTVKTISPADAWKKHTERKKANINVPKDPKTGKTLYQKVTSEETEELDENAKIVAHLQKRYGDNIRKSHVRSAANDFGVGYVALSHAVRKKLGKKMLDEEEQIDELSRATVGRYAKRAKDEADYGNPLKSRSKGREMAARKRWGGTSSYVKPARVPATEETQIDELSKATLGSYVKKATRNAAGSAAATAAIASSSKGEAPAKTKRDLRNRLTGVSKAVDKLTKESRKTEALADIEAIKQMNESYKTTFDAALETYGIKSPSELDEEKRKEFFNHVDQNYKKGDK